MLRRSFLSALGAVLVIAALAAPTAVAASTRLVASSSPWVPQLDPAGSIGRLHLVCSAFDPGAVRASVSCSTSNGASASASGNALDPFMTGAPAVTVAQSTNAGGFGSYTFCAHATFTYAGGATETVGPKCVQADGLDVTLVTA